MDELMYVKQYTEMPGCLYPCTKTKIRVRRRMEKSNFVGGYGVLDITSNQHVQVYHFMTILETFL